MECPKCMRINHPEAQRCDCGYDFESNQMKKSYLKDVKKRKPGFFAYVLLVWLVLGLLFSEPIVLVSDILLILAWILYFYGPVVKRK